MMSFRDHGIQQCDVSTLNRLKLAAKVTIYKLGGIVRRYLNNLLINLCFLSQCCKDEIDDPDSPSHH